MVGGWAGVVWYGGQIALAGRIRHRDAGVTMEQLRRGLDVHYHGLRGTLARRTVGDAGLHAGPRWRTLFGAGVHDLLAWLDPEQVHLPRSVDRYPTPELNRELLYWLAAFMAEDRPLAGTSALPLGVRHLLQGVATSARLLRAFPGLVPRHARLCAAELAQRVRVLPGWHGAHPACRLEAAIRQALGAEGRVDDPWFAEAMVAAQEGRAIPERRRRPGVAVIPFLPVALWGQPPIDGVGLRLFSFKRHARRRSEGRVANLARARFDPERIALRDTGDPAVGRFVYPEWSDQEQAYRPDWCTVTESVPAVRPTASRDEPARPLVVQVRRQFEALQQRPGWRRRLDSGDELELDACVTSFADAQACGRPDTRVWQQREPRWRDLSVAVLLDASRSTEAWIDEHRVIGIARRSMLVLGEALAAAGDDFGLYTFASESRRQVWCRRIKGFDEPYDDAARARLWSVEPGHYTRLGAALRHVGARLESRPARQRLLIVLTDGRPHDPVDGYVGRQALEDTRRALLELRSRGVHGFGLTIDRLGADYLPRLFGPDHRAVYSDPRRLPQLLPRLLARVTARTT